MRRQHLLAVGLLAIGLAIRFWGLGFGLPYLYHPDEPRKVAVVIRMLREHDPNPHFFNQPSFFLYLLSLGYVPYLLAGMALGRFGSAADLALPEVLAMGVGRISLPSEFLLARAMVACFGGLTVLLAWRIGHRHHSPRAGILAGALLALSPSTRQQLLHYLPQLLLLSPPFNLWPGFLRIWGGHKCCCIPNPLGVSFQVPKSSRADRKLAHRYYRRARANFRKVCVI